MRQSRLPYSLLIFLFVIFGLNFAGLRYDWYHIFWWFDIPMHIAGGAWVALAAIYALEKYYFPAHRASHVMKVFLVLTSVMVIGVLWELFEYSMDIFIFKKYTFASIPGYIRVDSFQDLLDDLLGAILVLFVARKLIYTQESP